MITLMSRVQCKISVDQLDVDIMRELYTKMAHQDFLSAFINILKVAMHAEQDNEYAQRTLLFCAEFVCSYIKNASHPLFVDTLNWLVTTTSNRYRIRLRLCEFVNIMVNAHSVDFILDDGLCDNILTYMMSRLSDDAGSVRAQAIAVLMRLEKRYNLVSRTYLFHLNHDPSMEVRQVIINCMGLNERTIPILLDQLKDVDENVRCQVYKRMCTYPVGAYKVARRQMLLENGLNDRSDMVRRVVVTNMLQLWIKSYQNNLIKLLSGLKLDSTEVHIIHFRKIAKPVLRVIFKQLSVKDLLACLPIENDDDYHRCVPYDKLTIEMVFYWQCLLVYLQSEMAEEADLVLPELNDFCAYVTNFCATERPMMDASEQIEVQYKLLSLMEIAYIFDLGDECGRGVLKKLLVHLLRSFYLKEKVVAIIVRCAENIITSQNQRMQFFLEIINDISGQHAEQQNNLVCSRSVTNKLMASSMENEKIVKSLQIAFHMVVSPKVNHLNPSVYNFYRMFIRRHIGSSHIATNEWALKCGTAYSMLYETIANEVFDELYSQLFKNQNILIWEILVEQIFELLDFYGIDKFAGKGQQFPREVNDSNAPTMKSGADIIYMMSQFLGTFGSTNMTCIVKGFCRLLLHGHVKCNTIMQKLLLCYLNPGNDTEVHQILSVFLCDLINSEQQAMLQPALLPTVTAVLRAPYGNPLFDICPRTITKFVIDATCHKHFPASGGGGPIHNKLAESFLKKMLCNASNEELCMLLAEELTTLELNIEHNIDLVRKMKIQTRNLIYKKFNKCTERHLMTFKNMLNGIPRASLLRKVKSKMGKVNR